MQDYTPKKGIFKPQRLETLKPEAKPFIGKEFLFEYMYRLDRKPYVGQVAYQVSRPDGIGYREWMDSMSEAEQDFAGLWIPEEDIDFMGVHSG